MAIAIPGIVRLQDAHDVNVTPGAGVDDYALTYDNGTGKFVLSAAPAGVLLSTGATIGATSEAQTFNFGVVINETSNDSDTRIEGNGDANLLFVDASTDRVGIGINAPTAKLHVVGDADVCQLAVKAFATQTAAPFQLLNSAGTVIIKADEASGYCRLTSGLANNGFWFIGSFGVSNDSMVQNMNAGSGLYFTSNGSLILYTPTTHALRVDASDNIGIGLGSSVAPTTRLDVRLADAGTNAVVRVVTFSHDTSGTAASGFGADLAFALQSSTTVKQDAALISALWYEATHATRKADLVLSAFDTAVREGLRIRGNGSAPAIGFLGATPAARIAHVGNPAGGATVDAEARTIINSILSTLETFGFHATS